VKKRSQTTREQTSGDFLAVRLAEKAALKNPQPRKGKPEKKSYWLRREKTSVERRTAPKVQSVSVGPDWMDTKPAQAWRINSGMLSRRSLLNVSSD
jgi:hypothetical protein